MGPGGASGADSDLDSQKRALRARLLGRRRRLVEAVRERAGELVAEALAVDERLQAARFVGLHASTADELPTRPTFEALRQQRAELLFPRVVGGVLEFVAIRRWEMLVPGAYGVLEPPADRPAIALGDEDAVLVPGVAFDECGGRLGRGGGHYDRTFAGSGGAWLVGVAFECQMVPAVPRHSRDRSMDAIVTERGLRRVSRGTRGGSSGKGS